MKKTFVSIIVMMLMLAVSVSAAFDFTVSANPETPAEATLGGLVTYEYTVENLGPDDEENISVEWTALDNGGVTMGGYSASASGLFDLANGATEGPVQAQFFVPANQKAGVYTNTYSLMVNDVEEATDSLSITVESVPGTSLSAPANTDLVQGQIGQFTLSIQNTGNDDLSLTVSGPDFSDGNGQFLSYAVSQNPKSVDYAQSDSVDITFNVPGNQATGVYTTTLTLTDGGFQDTIQVQVTVSEPQTSVAVTEGEVNFGEERRDQVVEQSFTVKNDGDVTLNNVVISENLGSEYDAQLSDTAIASLAPGAEVSVDLELTLPDDEDAGQKTLGTLSITSDEGASTNVPIRIEPENMLEISEVKVEVGDKSKKSYDDGDVIKDVQPLVDVEFQIEVENLFDDNGDYDFDIEDVTLELTVFDIDDEDDLEYDADEFDIDADDKETETIKFTVPITVDDDEEYNVEILVEGQDENGAEHTFQVDMKLKVEKEKHELSFETAELSPSSVSCQKTTVLNVELVNLGADDEDDVVIRVKNDALNLDIFEEVGDMSSDWDDDEFRFQKYYTINVPSNLDEGSYPIKLEAFREDDDLEGIETITFQKTECTASDDDEDDNSDFEDFEDFDDFEDFQQAPSSSGSNNQPSGNVDVVFTDTPTTTIPQAPSADDSNFVSATTVDSSDEGSSVGYLVLLALGNVAVVVLILVLIARALKKRND